MSAVLSRRRSGEVARAQRVISAQRSRDPFGHRKLRVELRAGNPYVLAILSRRGLTYRDGAIRKATP